MAIYSLNLGFISRSAGRSAVGFSAYIAAARHQDERTGVIHNYECKSDVIVSRVLAPVDAPNWAKNPSTLWNRAEQFEDDWGALRFQNLRAREQFLSSAQTAQTIMGAIPIEFSQLEAEACVEEFLLNRFVSRKLVVEYAIHWDKGNPHFHGLITRRPLENSEFAQRKDRDIVTKAEHNITRKQWEVVVNKHLELGGHEVRIDSRSYADQGLSFLPTHHEGWYVQRFAERGEYSRIIADNEAIRQKNIEILCERPETLIQEVALKRTVFTRRHIEEEIIRRVGGDEKLFSLLKAKVEGISIPSELILKTANQNVMFEGGIATQLSVEIRHLAGKFTDELLDNKDVTYAVGENINRERIFTSTAYKAQEDTLLHLADTLSQRQTKAVYPDLIQQGIVNREAELKNDLFQEQKDTIAHLCSGPDICILNGKAGTGKTTLLKAVAEAYQGAGYHVLGASFQGKAVEIMEQEIGIPCKTLDSFLCAWEKHQKQKDLVESGKLWGRPYLYAFNQMKELEESRFTSKNVIIVDEANMVGGRLWEPFLEEAVSKGAKVLIVQDPAQIKSRDPGDYGRLFADRYCFIETNEVVRQRIPWQRECSKLLNEHQVLDGVMPYYEKGHFTWFNNRETLIDALASDYVKDLIRSPHQNLIALAYRNTEVYELNQAIRHHLKQQGELKDTFTLSGQEYAIGDRIRFPQNDNHGQFVKNLNKDQNEIQIQFKGIKNGTFGTIEAYDEKVSLFTGTMVRTVTVALEKNRRVCFNPEEYQHITHGYAMGVHKSEGGTFDKSYVSLDPLLDPSTLLVGLTRHRLDTELYVNREEFIDFKDVVDRIGRVSCKETVQDYHVSEDQKPFFNRVQHYRDLIGEGVTLREEMEGELNPKTPLYKHPSYPAYQLCFEEKKRVASSILEDWKNHAPYARLAGLRKDVLEVEAGLRPRLLSDLEYRASIQVQGYMDLVKETRVLWHTISETHPGVLARSHTLYEDYASKKTERDSLAFVFQENQKLYTPFLRVTKACTPIKSRAGSRVPPGDETGELKGYWGEFVSPENRVYISALKSHAEAHQRSQLQNLYYERLSSEDKAHYDIVKAYVSVRNEAAAIYSHLRKQETDSVQMTFPEGITLYQFHEKQAKRDELALKIVESPEKYQVYFDTLKVKEDKLLAHAVTGELRENVQAYAIEQDISKRASQAQELKRILTTSKDYRIFKERGLDANRLTFDIAFYDKVSKGDIDSQVHPEEVYKPIQSYLNASREVAQLWKTIKVKSEKSEQTEFQQTEWKNALKALNENAHQIANYPASLAVISEMREGIEARIMKQVGFIQRTTSSQDHSFTKMSNNNHVPTRGALQENRPYVSIEQVRQAIRGNTESITRDLLGEPNKHMSKKTELRFGNNGSLRVSIAGPNEGLWNDFESGEKGNFFHLIQREKRLNFNEAVSYLADVLNVKDDLKTVPSTKPIKYNEKISIEAVKDRAQRLNAVSELQMKSKLIEGTLAESYLRQERGITGPLASDLRYIPKGTTFMYQGERKILTHHCLAAFGKDHEGRLSSVQLTKLDDQGKRALTIDGEKWNKIQYGVAKGSFVLLQDDKTTNCVFIAEGLETALSIKEANVKGKIIASLGIHNISNYLRRKLFSVPTMMSINLVLRLIRLSIKLKIILKPKDKPFLLLNRLTQGMILMMFSKRKELKAFVSM